MKKKQAFRGECPPEVRAQFGDHFEKYLNLRRAMGIKEISIGVDRDYHRNLWVFLQSIGFIGDELDVTKKEVQLYAEYTYGRADLNHNSALAKVRCLRTFYREAVKQEWIMIDPFAGFQFPKEEQIVKTVLSLKQVKSILECIDLSTIQGYRDLILIHLLYGSGLRREEVVGLKEKNFLDDFRRVRIVGKGDKEEYLPVTRICAHYLRFYCKEVFPVFNVHGVEPLFLSTTDFRPLQNLAVNSIVRGYVKKAGIKQQVSPHSFRVAICTHLAEAGVDIRLLQTFMRHEKVSTTGRYIHHTFKKLQQVHGETHPRA